MHLLRYHYTEGGLTFYMFSKLIECAHNREYEQMRFTASLQGVDLDKAVKKGAKTSSKGTSDGMDSQRNTPVFGDPREYANMTPEQREREMARITRRLKDAKVPITYQEK